jgi:MarR family transcriptional regulator, organic hydroperoxide resistance regulator
VLRRLEGRGILQRRPDPRDARRALFMLTAKGRKVDTIRTGTVEQAVRRVLLKDPQRVSAAQEVLASLSVELDAGLR